MVVERQSHVGVAGGLVSAVKAMVWLSAVVAALISEATGLSRYALTLKVYQVSTKNDHFDFSNTLEQVDDWQDILIVDIGKSADGQHGIWTAWKSPIPDGINTIGQMPHPLHLEAVDPVRRCTGKLDLPEKANALPVLGANAKLSLIITNRD